MFGLFHCKEFDFDINDYESQTLILRPTFFALDLIYNKIIIILVELW